MKKSGCFPKKRGGWQLRYQKNTLFEALMFWLIFVGIRKVKFRISALHWMQRSKRH